MYTAACLHSTLAKRRGTPVTWQPQLTFSTYQSAAASCNLVSESSGAQTSDNFTLSIVRLFLKSLCGLLIKNMASPLQKPRLSVPSPTPTVFGAVLPRSSLQSLFSTEPWGSAVGYFTGGAASSTVEFQCYRATDHRQYLGCYDWRTDWASQC